MFYNSCLRSVCGSGQSDRGAVVGETLDFGIIKPRFSGREVDLLHDPAHHKRPERRSGDAAKNRHRFSGIDQMAGDVCPLTATEDAFRLFLGYAGVGLQDGTDSGNGLSRMSYFSSLWTLVGCSLNAF